MHSSTLRTHILHPVLVSLYTVQPCPAGYSCFDPTQQPVICQPVSTPLNGSEATLSIWYQRYTDLHYLIPKVMHSCFNGGCLLFGFIRSIRGRERDLLNSWSHKVALQHAEELSIAASNESRIGQWPCQVSPDELYAIRIFVLLR